MLISSQHERQFFQLLVGIPVMKLFFVKNNNFSEICFMFPIVKGDIIKKTFKIFYCLTCFKNSLEVLFCNNKQTNILVHFIVTCNARIY